MLVLGIDQSISRTGYAFYESPGDERAIRCGHFTAGQDDAEMQCELFAQHLKQLIGKHRHDIDYICWERISPYIAAYPKKGRVPDIIGDPDAGMGFTVNAKQLLLPEIQGTIRAYAIAYRIPHESVSARTWRAAIYGKGGGALKRDEAKKKALSYCSTLGIPAENDDEAEAACIAIWAARCSQHCKMIQYVGAA